MTTLQRFSWFFQRPNLYPESFRRVKRNIKSLLFPALATHTALARSKAKAQATEWCENSAIDTNTAILKITGLADFETFYEKFKQQMRLSEEIVKKCPIKMGGAGNLDLVYHLAETLQATKVIETGVAYGWSSLALLMSLKNRNGSMLVSTDLPYQFKDSEKYVGCAVPSELKFIWKIIYSPDREALPQAEAILPTIDMCHYDSDKFYEGRLWAYPRLWKAIRPGGIFISDDVDDDLGFRDFCNSIEQEPLIVKFLTSSGVKYVGVLTKPQI